MALGNCKKCAGQLGVLQGPVADGQGRLVGVDGRPVHVDETGRTSGPVAQRWQVACVVCHVPDLDHPYQRELNEAAEKRQAQRLAPPPPAPHQYTMVNELDLILRRQDALEKRLAAIQEENAALYEEWAQLRQQGGKRR